MGEVPMKQRTKLAQLLMAVVVVAAAVLVVGPGYQNSTVRMRSGTLWLTSAATGEATLLDGATAEVAARVAIGEPSPALHVTQHDGAALVHNRETGALSRVDTATLQVTAANGVLLTDSALVAGSAPGVIFGVGVHSGTVTAVDPGTLTATGRPARLAGSLRPDNVVVDGRGRLWTIDDSTGDLVWLAGEERRTRPAAGKTGRLAITADQPALVDPERGTAELISPETGAASRSLRTGLQAGDAIAVSGSAHRSRVLITTPTRGELIVCTFDTGSCADPVRLGDPGAELGAPIEVDGHAVVPDFSTGQAMIIDLATSEVVAERRLFDRPTRFELLTRDGFVFFNDPNGNTAGVLDLTGDVRTITKYTDGPGADDVPPAPDPRGQADQLTKIDHRLPQPGMGLPGRTTQKAPPAAKPTPSIVVSPDVHGEVGDEFELTIVPQTTTAASTSWSFGDGTGAMGATVRHRWQHPGTFTVRATATLENGGTAQSETAVTVAPEGTPTSIARLDIRRPRPVIGESVHFGAEITGPRPDSWRWTVTRPGTAAPEITANTAEFDHRFATTGVYTVSLTVTSGARTVQSSRQLTVSRGAVKLWGDDRDGLLRVPPTLSSGVVAIDGGWRHCLALKADGTLIAWGDDSQTAVPPNALTGVVAISAGPAHSLVLKADGSVVSWGFTPGEPLEVPAAAQRDVIAIAAGSGFSVALKANGEVIAWGTSNWDQTTVPHKARSGVIAIAAGTNHSLALKADGSVITWGNSPMTNLDVPPSADHGVAAVAAGDDRSVVMKRDGSIIQWGFSWSEESGIPPSAHNGVVSLDLSSHHYLALKADGSVLGWGMDREGETSLPPEYDRKVLAVSAGDSYSMVVVDDLD
jgi:PKD repeat protein